MILHLGCVLGRLGSLLGRLVGVKPIMPRSRSTKIEDFELSWAARSTSLGVCGVSWVVLGPFGPSCRRLGDGLGVWGLFEAMLGRLGGVLGMGEASRKLIGPSALRASWGWVEGVWVAAWAVLGASGASWVHLGCVLGRGVSEAYSAVRYTTLGQILNGSLSIFF